MKKTKFKTEHGFKSSCREGEDPLDTSKVPLRKRLQKGSLNYGKKMKQADGIEGTSEDPECSSSFTADFLLANNADKVAGEISELESYIHLLKCGQIYAVDESLTTFVVPDIDTSKFILKEEEFFIVKREPKSFSNEVRWVYSCFCDPNRHKLLESLSDHVVTDFEVFSTTFKQCLHCQAVCNILQEVDGFYDICPEIQKDHDYTNKTSANVEIKESFPLSRNVLCICGSSGIGIVKVNNSYFNCLTCRSSSCVHVTEVHLIFDTESNDLGEELLDWRNNHTDKEKELKVKIKCLSSKKIPFDFTEDISSIFKQTLDVRFGNWRCNLAIPEQCKTCCTSEFDPICKSVDVITENCIYTLKVNTWKCKACKTEESFDGQEYGVINMGMYCVVYEVMRRYLSYFLQGKSTMFTEYVALCQMYKYHGHLDVDKQFSYQRLQLAWYSYINLLDVTYEEGFTCSKCGPEPSVVVMDATTLSFRKRMLSWRDVFLFAEKPCSEPVKGSSQVFLNRPECRRQLKKFALHGMDNDEYAIFMNSLEGYEKCLTGLLLQIKNENKTKKKITCCQEVRSLLRSLSSETPACGLVLPTEENRQLLKKLTLISSDAEKIGKIQKVFPILFNIIRKQGEIYMENLEPIMDVLLTRAGLPFKPLLNISEQFIADRTSTEANSLSYFPSLPVLRERGLYEADVKNVKQPSCRKRTHSHPTLLPGLFTILCPHGVCYGYEVMTVAESPNVPFTVLKTRFSKAPELIIYDNACNLHRYCLNRDPHFFKNTQFKVDGFHWDNHFGCSDSYELKSFPQYKDLNSQVVEQFNSQIKKLKGTVSYMTRNNFFNHIKLFVWGKNNNALER